MDDEDLAEASEQQKLQTNDAFAGLGTTAQDEKQQVSFMDLFQPQQETIGSKLLRRMGWREGQGIGPKTRRKVDSELKRTSLPAEEQMVAPRNSRMIRYVRKDNRKGIGYQGEARLRSDYGQASANDVRNDAHGSVRSADESKAGNSTSKDASRPRKGAFGVGVLNDDGSGDEDPYSSGPKISYNRTIGGTKKQKAHKKQPEMLGRGTNSMLPSKHVFRSKLQPSAARLRRCHDGSMPLSGFVLAEPLAALNLEENHQYAAPEVPEGWQSRKATTTNSTDQPQRQSTADAAKASTLDARARADILGEKPLPGKSVFDFISPAARDRIATASQKKDLPPGRGEQVPAAGCATETRPTPTPGQRETSSQSSRPISGLMASRFTSAGVSLPTDNILKQASSSQKEEKVKDPAEEAAAMGMYGPTTRSYHHFYPTRIVCKRFNVKLPFHVEGEESGTNAQSMPEAGTSASSNAATELVSAHAMERLRQEASLQFPRSSPFRTKVDSQGTSLNADLPAEVDVSVNTALEGEKAGEELYKDVFGDDEDNERC